MIFRVLTIFLSVLLTSLSLAQTAKIDSLKALLQKADSKLQKIELYGQLGECDQKKSEALGYLNQGLRLAKGYSLEMESKLYSSFGRVYFKAKQGDSTLVYMNKKIALWERNSHKKKAADAYITRGKYANYFLLYEDALISFKKAFEIYEEINDVEGQIESLSRQGKIHKNIGNYAHALPMYYDAHELARLNGLPNELAAASVNIGIVLKNQGNYKDAIEYYTRAKEIYEIDGDEFGLANVYNNLGNVQRLQGDLDNALKHYLLTIELRKKTDNNKQLSYTYNNIGLVYTDKGDLEQALTYLKKSEKLKLETEDYASLASTYLNYADIYLIGGNETKFVYYSNLAEQLGKKYQQREVVRKSLINRSEFESKRGDYKKAYLYLTTVYAELDTLDEKEQKILNASLMAQYKSKEHKLEISELSAENATLESQKVQLEKSEKLFHQLILSLVILTVVLILTTALFFYKQKAFKAKSRELVKTNEQLRKTMVSNDEKEVLLKEVHHRVKNNLQIIKSLIRLQNSSVNDKRTSLLLMEFEQRVSSMALVHESLYKSKDLARVDLNNYFKTLITDLIDAYKLGQEVQANLSVEVENLGIDTLVPLGLLTNEIISNSLKHGFEPNSNGIIKVDLKKIDDLNYQLYIGDNGKGFDFEEERSEKDSLGIELIQALVDQLDGEFEFFNENGAYYRIKFKLQEKK